jgi:hypothetical protein
MPEAFDRLAMLAEMRHPHPSPDYAFTEIRTFHDTEESVIEDEASEEGKIWANTVRTYLENEGTKLLWWGRLLEAPQVVKLAIGTSCAPFQVPTF